MYAGGYEELLNKGDEFYKKLDNFNALKQYEKAYAINPSNYEVLTKLTRVYNDYGEELIELNRHDKAEGYINKAIKMSGVLLSAFPDSALTYTYRALALGNHAMFVGGKEKIKLAHQIRDNALKAVKLNPNDFLPYIILGIYYRELANLSWLERTFANTFFGNVPEGSFADSEKVLKKALAIDDAVIMIHYQIAKTYRYMEKTDLELQYLKKVKELPIRDFRDKFTIAKTEKRLEELK